MIPTRRRPLEEADRETLAWLADPKVLHLPVLVWPWAGLVAGAALIWLGVGRVSVSLAGILGGLLIAAGVVLCVVGAMWLHVRAMAKRGEAMGRPWRADAKAVLASGEVVVAEVVCDAAWVLPDEYPDPGDPRVLVRLAAGGFVLLPEAPGVDGPAGGEDKGADGEVSGGASGGAEDGRLEMAARSEMLLSDELEREPFVIRSVALAGAARVRIGDELLRSPDAEARAFTDRAATFRVFQRAELPASWRGVVGR